MKKKMNRQEKVDFIQREHHELYELLKANAYEYLEDVWAAKFYDITSYNNLVAFYCDQKSDKDLMDLLLV